MIKIIALYRIRTDDLGLIRVTVGSATFCPTNQRYDTYNEICAECPLHSVCNGMTWCADCINNFYSAYQGGVSVFVNRVPQARCRHLVQQVYLIASPCRVRKIITSWVTTARGAPYARIMRSLVLKVLEGIVVLLGPSGGPPVPNAK